jgi:guanine nucleotide-binding protein G(i) subunit alpha
LLTLQEFARIFLQKEISIVTAETIFTQEVLHMINSLWSEKSIQQQFAKRFNLHVFDGAPHFFKTETLQRLDPLIYNPSFEDVLYCRRKTTGVVEAVAKIPNYSFHFLDVGGQRSERKKWNKRFGSVDALIFVVSLSEFDQMCYEDEETRRLDDSMDLFDQTINSTQFTETPIIIFFNVRCSFFRIFNFVENGSIQGKITTERFVECVPRVSRWTELRCRSKIHSRTVSEKKQT